MNEIISTSYKESLYALSKVREEFAIAVACGGHQLPIISMLWLKNLSRALDKTGVLVNLKGRDRNDVLFLKGYDTPVTDHELVFLSGHIPSNDPDPVPFSLSLNATFLTLKKGTFHHSVKTYCTSTHPIKLNQPLTLFYAAPVTPECLRGCLQFFDSTFFSSCLGVFPTISQSITFEMTLNTFALQLWCHRSKRTPHIQDSLAFSCAEPLANALGVSLKERLFQVKKG